MVCHIPKVNQEQVNYLNRPISQKEVEEVIKSCPTPPKNNKQTKKQTKQNKQNNNNKKTKQKTSRPDGFSAQFYQTFKEDLISIFLNLFY
jgi:response regulator RpfG family c-di-GMP phosphodiesterase